MNILILLSVIIGLTHAQRGVDIRDCDYDHGAASGRGLQNSYQRPSAYDTVDYVPQTSYGPPDPVRLPPQRNYPQDTGERESNPRPAYAQPPTYSQVRPAPIYGPPPSRARVAAAAGIYEDYEDIQYAQPPPPPPLPVVRHYNFNYAQREPYQPSYEYYLGRRRPEYRVPVYYAPLIPDGFIPVHSHASVPSSTEKSTTEDTHLQAPTESYHTDHQDGSSGEQVVVYDETQIRRQQPTVNPPSLKSEIKRHLFRKPFVGLRNLFRGSILAKRNKIGLIPSIVQGSTNNFT